MEAIRHDVILPDYSLTNYLYIEVRKVMMQNSAQDW